MEENTEHWSVLNYTLSETQWEVVVNHLTNYKMTVNPQTCVHLEQFVDQTVPRVWSFLIHKNLFPISKAVRVNSEQQQI